MPSINQIAEFLLYLFQERKLQPSTIDGYRTAIADKLGNSSGEISKDENLTPLLDSFHRDRPKGHRGIPSWNLSFVLCQLTKAPFKPIRKASQKHLIFKTVFLLALASGKRSSEIHGNPKHERTFTTGKTSLKSLFNPPPVFFLRIKWLVRAPTVWLQWLSQHCSPPWTNL